MEGPDIVRAFCFGAIFGASGRRGERMSHLVQAAVMPDLSVCGPPPLVEGAREVAVAAGIPDAPFASERFAV